MVASHCTVSLPVSHSPGAVAGLAVMSLEKQTLHPLGRHLKAGSVVSPLYNDLLLSCVA